MISALPVFLEIIAFQWKGTYLAFSEATPQMLNNKLEARECVGRRDVQHFVIENRWIFEVVACLI